MQSILRQDQDLENAVTGPLSQPRFLLLDKLPGQHHQSNHATLEVQKMLEEPIETCKFTMQNWIRQLILK